MAAETQGDEPVRHLIAKRNHSTAIAVNRFRVGFRPSGWLLNPPINRWLRRELEEQNEAAIWRGQSPS